MTTPERLIVLAEAEEPRAEFTNLFFLTPGEGITELFLIRHGQVEADIDMGADARLTALGREQASVLATYLSSKFRFDAVYASPALRAQETAEPLAGSQNFSLNSAFRSAARRAHPAAPASSPSCPASKARPR